MGATTSKASSVVDSVINAGMSVMKTTASNSVTPVTNINQIHIKGCKGVVIDNVSMKNWAKVDVESFTKAISSVDLQMDIENIMKSTAKSEAKGGLGYTESEAAAFSDSITDLTMAVKEATTSFAEASTSNINDITCEDSQDITLRNINMENFTSMMVKQVTESASVTKARQSLIQQIVQDAKSKATGWDITGILIAIIVIIAFVLFGGLGLIAKTLTSISFWMLASGAITGLSVYGLISSWIGTWPSQKIDVDKDSEDVIVKKTKRNKTIRTISGIALPIATVATIGFGYAFVKHKK
jgi:hypothetical protein